MIFIVGINASRSRTPKAINKSSTIKKYWFQKVSAMKFLRKDRIKPS
jgi:hypothetical protein